MRVRGRFIVPDGTLPEKTVRKLARGSKQVLRDEKGGKTVFVLPDKYFPSRVG
jgi:hypothetical protein